ncbi:hypothetical protein AAC387_Pa07g1369 [Persea americana]
MYRDILPTSFCRIKTLLLASIFPPISLGTLLLYSGNPKNLNFFGDYGLNQGELKLPASICCLLFIDV